jgi:dephospho-CoA kinase
VTAASRNDKPLRIGLTGGIASGKTTVADLFEALGAQIIDTDIIAREVAATGQPALTEIREAFGPEVIDESGALDRAAMRELVFSDAERRRQLESILHPRIVDETMRQSGALNGPYQVIVVPLLTESKLQAFVDRVLVVDCDEETQIRRLLARDAESEAQARRILAAQATREERLAIADDVVNNNGNLDATRAQVRKLHEIYQSLA